MYIYVSNYEKIKYKNVIIPQILMSKCVEINDGMTCNAAEM